MSEELQRLVDGLAARLGRNVAVDDLGFRLLAYSAQVGEIDDMRARVILTREAPPEAVAWLRAQKLGRASGPVRLPANPELGILARVVIPVSYQGMRFGYLWLIDVAFSMSDEDIALAVATSIEAGEVLFRARVVSDLRTAREGELLRDLLSDEQSVRGLAADRLVESGLFAPRGDVRVLVMRPIPSASHVIDEDDRLALQLALDETASSLHSRECLRLVRPDHAVLVIAAKSLSRAAGLPHALRHAARERLAHPDRWSDVHVAVGSAARQLVDAAISYRQALDALRVASVVPSFAPVVAHETIGIYAMLASQPVDQLGSYGIHPAVRRLLEADRELVGTAETYLDLAGDARATADELRLHRASVYARIRRIEQISELSLADGQHRLLLHLGIKVARLLGLY